MMPSGIAPRTIPSSSRTLDRRQGGRLRVEVAPDLTDLMPDRRHQPQHLLVGGAGLGREQLDDGGHRLPIADREGGHADEPGLGGELQPPALRRGLQLLDPDRLTLGRGLTGRVLTRPQHRYPRHLDDVRAQDVVRRPDRLTAQHPLLVGRPVHRERPVQLRRHGPEDLGDRLLERPRLEQRARGDLLDRDPLGALIGGELQHCQASCARRMPVACQRAAGGKKFR
jgi:hypothetical protein